MEAELRRIQRELSVVQEKLAALDATMAAINPLVAPDAAGTVKAWAGKYGERGAVKDCVLSHLQAAGKSGIDVSTLTLQVAAALSVDLTTLQRKASSKLLRGMTTCVVAGVFLTLGVALLAGGLTLGGGALIAGAVGLFVLADARFGKPALDTAKEHDRRYFLQSIRAARACNELDWAGLFSHNGVTRPGPQGDEDIEQSKLRVAELSAQLRSALYNDEYRAYSSCGARAT